MMVTALLMAGSLLIAAREDFKVLEYRHTSGQSQNIVFPYRLFVPRLSESEQCPLLVWLHGRGQAGSDNQQHLCVADTLANADCPYFILAVQCPAADPFWSPLNSDAAIEILHKTIREQPVDPSRIYLAGISSGGSGCWDMAMRHPELFAAVVPMSSSGGDVLRAENLVGIPIWAFINEGERKAVEDIVAAVKRTGGNVHLTVMQAPGHDSWTVPMHNGIMEWVLAQRRGEPCWTPPTCRSWLWWHILTLPCALLVFMRLTWCIEQWRRRRKTSSVMVSESETADADFFVGSSLAEGDPAESVVEGFENCECAGVNAP